MLTRLPSLTVASLLRASALFAGVLATASIVPAEARTRPAGAMSASAAPVIVDVSRLRTLGLGPIADLVQTTIASALRDRAPAGTRLVVRVDALSMGSFVGSEGGGGGSGTGGENGGSVGTDSMEGVGLLVGPGGDVRASYPIVLTLPSDSGGAYYLPGDEQRRIVVLSQNFVRWIERKLG